MGALQHWLGPLPVDRFRAEHLGRRPCAGSGSAGDVVPACDWQILDRLLAAQPADLLVVARGRLLDIPPPRSLGQLRVMFAQGVGIALRGPEPHSPEVAAIAEAVARDLPGEQRVIVFATARQSHGFGWHYDAEDVFIVQTGGNKTYYFRETTGDTRPARGAQPDFRTIRLEHTPIMECRLTPGDWLYLPRGYWHVARAHTDSLSLSIGIFPDEP